MYLGSQPNCRFSTANNITICRLYLITSTAAGDLISSSASKGTWRKHHFGCRRNLSATNTQDDGLETLIHEHKEQRRCARCSDLEPPLNSLPALTLPEHIARRITQGPRWQDAGAEQLAARLGTVTLDGSAGAGFFDCIAERLTMMDLEPASVDGPRQALGPVDP